MIRFCLVITKPCQKAAKYLATGAACQYATTLLPARNSLVF